MPENAETSAATKKFQQIVDRRNTAAAKVRKLEDALYEAKRALNLAENKVRAAHANAPVGTLIRYGGEAWEVLHQSDGPA